MKEPVAGVQSYAERVAALRFDGMAWTREQLLEIRDFLAPWDHNIALPHGVYTTACEAYYPAHQEIMRVVHDRLGGEFSHRRILDVGCLEGYFSIECALQGARVLGIDGKLLNIRKCEFVRSALSVDRAVFALRDAREVTAEAVGRFDVVLALGLLYHLEDPFVFLRSMASLCDGFAVIDTHIALEHQPASLKKGWQPELSEMRTFDFGGKLYEGRLCREFEPGTPRDQKDLSPTASLDNDLSVWLSEEALVQMLHDVGFSATEKIVFPKDADMWWSDLRRDSRVLLVAWAPGHRFRSKVFRSA